MKRTQAIAAYNAVMSIKLNKMSEEMTEAILSNTLTLATVNEQFDKVKEELRKRTIDTIDVERREEYGKITTKLKALDGQKRAALQSVVNDNYTDILKAEAAFIRAANRWLDKEVILDIDKIERKDFIAALKESEQNITPASLDELSVIFKGDKKKEVTIDEAEIDELLS